MKSFEYPLLHLNDLLITQAKIAALLGSTHAKIAASPLSYPFLDSMSWKF